MFSNNTTTCFEEDIFVVSPSNKWEVLMEKNFSRPLLSASLLPSLVFMYFLGYRGNGVNAMTYFGFQYALVFAIVVIPSGIITQSVYGLTFTNIDWLHGVAEILLTVSNLALLYGLTEKMSPTKPSILTFKHFVFAAYALAGLFIANTSLWAKLHVDPHTPLFFGIGNLPRAWTQHFFGDAALREPANALSLATWFVHVSTEVEYFFIMNLIWKLPDVTKTTSAWKGLTWGMLPLFAGGVAACTFHFFYNEVPFIASLFGCLTLVGNTTSAIAAYRIARANGWSLQQEVKMLWSGSSSTTISACAESNEIKPLEARKETKEEADSTTFLVFKMMVLTMVLSYMAKYGGIAFGCSINPHPAVPLVMVFGISSLVGLHFLLKSRKEAFKSLK